MTGAAQIMWASHDEADPVFESEPQWRGQPDALDVPGAALREASSVSDLGLFYTIGEAWAHLAARFARTDAPRVLDIGCGCGKMARFFVMNPRASYVGLDVFRPAIRWCRTAFANYPSFRFLHLDVHSELYNRTGRVPSDQVALPVDDGSADVVICGSLFTHLLEPAFRRYLLEVRRVLSGNGIALISIHDEPGEARFSGDEARIDISRAYWEELLREHELSVEKFVGNVFGQQLYVVGRAPDAARS